MKTKEEILAIINSYGGVIARLSKRLEWKPEKTSRFISNIWTMNKWAAFTIIFMEVAKIIDEEYTDHISESTQLWGLSSTDAKIKRVDPNSMFTYKNTPLFRSKTEAEIAASILSPLIKEMFFGNGQQKNKKFNSKYL